MTGVAGIAWIGGIMTAMFTPERFGVAGFVVAFALIYTTVGLALTKGPVATCLLLPLTARQRRSLKWFRQNYAVLASEYSGHYLVIVDEDVLAHSADEVEMLNYVNAECEAGSAIVRLVLRLPHVY